MGFNEFPELPDRFSLPVGHSQGITKPEEHARHLARCFPEIEEIVSRVREVRTSLLPGTILTRVYVLTNGPAKWLEQLKDSLQEDARKEGVEEWEHIVTSRDLRLTGEQRRNSQAVDMAVAQRAEVFLGNGVRDLSSSRPRE